MRYPKTWKTAFRKIDNREYGVLLPSRYSKQAITVWLPDAF